MGHTINNPLITITIPGTPSPTVYEIDDAASVTINGSRPVVSRPLFGDEGQRRDVKGLFDGSIDIDFDQDYNADQITQLLWDAMMSDDLLDIEIRAKDAEISANNPAWVGQIAVDAMTPIDGAAGELATGSITLPVHGVLDKITAPES